MGEAKKKSHLKRTAQPSSLPDDYGERISLLIGAESKNSLCPAFKSAEVIAYVDPMAPGHDRLIEDMTAQMNRALKGLKGFERNSIKKEGVAQVLRDFFAGVQYSWEKAPWPDLSKYTYHVHKIPNHNGSAYVRPAPGLSGVSLNITSGLVTEMAARAKVTMLSASKRFGKSFDNTDQAFIAGVEEGRHMSQFCNPELSARMIPLAIQSQRSGIQRQMLPTPGSEPPAKLAKKIAHNLALYEKIPGEKDVSDFVRENAKEIKARSQSIMKETTTHQQAPNMQAAGKAETDASHSFTHQIDTQQASRIAELVGAKDAASLCPTLLREPLLFLIDDRNKNHLQINGQYRDAVKIIMQHSDKRDFEAPKRRTKTTEMHEVFRQFAAGIQFAYEQERWKDNTTFPFLRTAPVGPPSAVLKIGDDRKMVTLHVNGLLPTYCLSQHKASSEKMREQLGTDIAANNMPFYYGLLAGRGLSQAHDTQLSRFIKTVTDYSDGGVSDDNLSKANTFPENEANRQDMVQFIQGNHKAISERINGLNPHGRYA